MLMNRVVLTLVYLGAIAVVLFTLDYLDHRKYSDRDDLSSYGLFIIHIISKGIIPISLATPLLIFMEWRESQLFMLVVSMGVLFIFYMNMYNFVSFPQRAVMILSSEIDGASEDLPLRFIFLHPSLILSIFRSKSYVYSLNSTRSVVLPFEEKDAYEFVTKFDNKNTGSCSCCGAEAQPIQRIRGKQMGYTDYNLVSFEYGEPEFEIASTMVVKLCESCWSDYKVLLANSKAVDETELVTELI